MNKSKIMKILGIFYSIMITVILVICVLGQDRMYRYRKEFLFDNYICIILGVVIYALLLGAVYVVVHKGKIQKYLPRIMIVISLMFTGVLFVMGYHYCFRTGWDVSQILNTVEGIVYDQPDKVAHWYYSLYPNNILLTAIYTAIYRIGAWIGVSNGYYLLLFLQSGIFAWTGYLVYRIAEMYFGKEKMTYTMLVWTVYMGMVGVSPWVVIPYSDTSSLFMVALCIFLYFKLCKEGITYLRLFALILCGMLGFYIKPQAFIIVIAIALILLVTSFKQMVTQYKYTIKCIGIIAAAFVCVWGIVQGATAFCGLEIVNEEKYGITHFFMMGLNRDSFGTISNEDVHISSSFYTYEERCKGNIEEAIRRIEKMGISGLADLAVGKTLVNYNDGTFGWGVEGNFYAELYENGNDFLRYFLRGFYYEDLNHYYMFAVWMQMLWMGTLLLSVFATKQVQDKRVAVLLLAIVGLTIFELVFEARARYLFAYAPVYILLAVIGLQGLVSMCKKIKGNRMEE